MTEPAQELPVFEPGYSSILEGYIPKGDSQRIITDSPPIMCSQELCENPMGAVTTAENKRPQRWARNLVRALGSFVALIGVASIKEGATIVAEARYYDPSILDRFTTSSSIAGLLTVASGIGCVLTARKLENRVIQTVQYMGLVDNDTSNES